MSFDFLKDYIRVDVTPENESFNAVKKYLGEKGPFSIAHRQSFTLQERHLFESNAPAAAGTGDAVDGLSRRVHEANLVLGYGLHSLKYRSRDLYVWYREEGEALSTSTQPTAHRYEKLTIYTSPFGASKPGSTTATAATAATAAGTATTTAASPVAVDDNAAITTAWELLKRFLNDALDFDQVRDNDSIRIFTINDRTLHWDLITQRPKRSLDSIFMKSSVKDDLVNDLSNFLKQREFYHSHGVPYKRGFLLYGPPGCGKTSLITAVASHFGLGICLLQIGHKGVTDNVLARLMMAAPSRSIILIEDIDTLFVSRTRANEDQSVTFSGFINALDGVGSSEGRVVFITTNHEAKLDVALLRPGRVDKLYKVEHAGVDELQAMFLTYFPNFPKKAKLFAESVVGNNVSTADIQQFLMMHKDNPEQAAKGRFEVVDTVAQRIAATTTPKDEPARSALSYISLW